MDTILYFIVESESLIIPIKFSSISAVILDHFLITAEEISHILTRSLKKYMDVREINHIRIAIREIIINAIEHGNLEISYNEKNEALINDNYFNLIIKRQNDPKYIDRGVYIEYLINPEKAVYKIVDDGDGFDHKKIINSEIDDLNNEQRFHGRGISMALGTFDKIEYNIKGNQVLLVKYLSK